MKTILVSTDFSETAQHAALYAAALTEPLGVSRIVLYHSYDQALVATDIPVAETDSTLAYEESLLALENIKNNIQPLIGGRVTIELVANELPLVLGVQQLVDQRKVDWVVAGTTGKSGLEKWMVGSNTVNLASSCPVPLLIIPKDAEFQPVKKIVFACDLHKVDKSTPVDLLRFLSDKLEAKLLVLNVEMEGKRFDLDTIPEQYKLHSLLDPLDPEYHYTEEGDIAKGIMAFAEDEGAGLVVTVPKKYGFFEGLFHRSVTTTLIGRTALPLLVLRERE